MNEYTTFKNLVICQPQGPPDPAEVAAVEQALGVALPACYRQFLDVANGGTLDHYSVRVPPTPEGEVLCFGDVFYPGRDGHGEYGYGTLLGELREHRRSLDLPREVLPIAQDGGGSTVYLDLTEKGAGRIVALVHGLPAWTGSSRQQDAFVELAPSFDAYVDLLFVDEEYLSETMGLLEDALRRGDEEQVRANRTFLDLAVPDWRDRFDRPAEARSGEG